MDKKVNIRIYIYHVKAFFYCRNNIVEPHCFEKKTWKSLFYFDREDEKFYILTNACHRDDYSTFGDHVNNGLWNETTFRAQTIAKLLMNKTQYEATLGKYDVRQMPTSKYVSSR